METREEMRSRFRSLTRKADAVSIPEADAEAVKTDLLIKYKERYKKEARRLADRGCYINGNIPKKSILTSYRKTREWRRTYERALSENDRYRACVDGSIEDDPGFNEELTKKLDSARRKARALARKDIASDLRKIAKQYIRGLDLEGFYAENRDRILQKELAMGEALLRSPRLFLEVPVPNENDRYKLRYEELTTENFEHFAEEYRGERLTDFLFETLQSHGICASSAFVSVLCASDDFLAEIYSGEDTGAGAADSLQRLAVYFTKDEDEDAFIREHYTYDRFLELVEQNPMYTDAVREGMLRRERMALISDGIADTIPRHYPDLFPLARAMKRHFILHIGPTNSGKTHDAIEALKNCDSGVYLAPLRLLAYEQYDVLNRAGANCTLVTGEERRVVEDAWLRSSTIEMLDFKQRYDVAVIDEAQMAADDDRGGAWTAAILGVRAKEIHICAAPSAEKLLHRLIEECGDDCETVYHERKTPLIFEHTVFEFPQGVRSGDALIVFSRRDVHAVAAELQKQGKKCSIIYGALPYDVRYEEARKFREGITDIVVATDAIGMGLNMPVRRIVFLQTDKFDGYERRELYDSEIQQIAGRAGRFGIYNEGLVNTLYDVPMIEHAVTAEVPPDEEAVVAFPEELLRINAPLSEILMQWAEMEVSRGFRKNLAESEVMLSKLLEEISDDKQLIYRFVTMAFDETNDELLAIWREMFICESRGEAFRASKYLPTDIVKDGNADDLPDLEEAFHVCDLLYGYMDRFGHPEGIPEVLAVKEQLSVAIMKILEKQDLAGRRCRECGRPLPWNYPFGVCERCHRGGGRMSGRSRRRGGRRRR